MSVKVLSVSASVCVCFRSARSYQENKDYFTSLLLMILLVLAPTWMFMRFLIVAFIACHRLFLCV